MNRKKLIKEKCANYKDGNCLIRDIECPLVIPYEYRNHRFPCNEVECDYFDIYVLGRKDDKKENMVTIAIPDTSVIKILPSNGMVIFSYKPCKRCDKQFRPTSRGKRYCSDFCRESARKQSYREANSKRK